MNNTFVLFVGELHRMKKYNILAASFVASLLWIGVLAFSSIEDVSHIFPLLVFLDATAMSMVMIGVTMFFEKQEGVIKTFLVAPIHKVEYLAAKSLANILSNVLTLLLLYGYAVIFKKIDVNLPGLIGAVSLIALFHSLIGVWLTYHSRDFTDLLVGMVKYTLVMMLPVLFEQLGVITSDVIKNILYVIPTKPAMLLLEAGTTGIESWELWLSAGYLLAASVLLFTIVTKKFDEFAMKESGV
ncbi:ABC transporter permease [Bacillus marinisedimentorum]|uniref:fluoroquinolone export ABC transporter permease subunit n=1 Tax=Bacillus marinisedimentorum TaxID=1821260 RepID=UPI0007E22F91|nr:ABC transporter permease [Bacillus marinisedimentorum]